MTVRVALATLDLAPTHGGIQTMTAQLVMRASEARYRVIAPADPGYKSVDQQNGWSIRRVPGLGKGRRGYLPSLTLAARREVAKADIGVAMHPMAALGFMASSKPFIVVTHGGELRSPRIRKIARVVFPRASRIVCNSRYTRSEAIALGADPLKCEVVPPGAPSPRGVSEDRIATLREQFACKHLVLCVGRLVPHKGQDALIEAVAQLDGSHLILVGTGPHLARLRALAQAKAVESRVTFAGKVSDDELAVMYAAADVFALCSRAASVGEQAGIEGAGIAILEAMSMRTPVVAAHTGGIPETVRDGITGLLVPPSKPAEIARALRRVLSDEALRERLVSNAFELVTTERSWARFIQRFEDICALVWRQAGGDR